MKADIKSPEGKIYYKKRANLNEAHFGLLRNVCNFQKLNRTGMKNAEKELTIHLIDKYTKNTRKTKRNTHLNKKNKLIKTHIQTTNTK